MKQLTAIFICCLTGSFVFSQSTRGITNKPDTSYTLYKAYTDLIKTHPQTKFVQDFKSEKVAVERDLVYCIRGKRKLLTDVFYSKEKSSAKRTAVIIIHGGGWRTGNKSLHHTMAQRLAELGYVCFTPEYRLSTEALYPAAVYDIKSAIRWVRKNAAKYNIDESKISVAGHSAGGELAAMMGATNNIATFEGDGCDKNYSSRVNAVIDMDGLLAFIHPESGEGDDSKRISAATNWFGFSKTENPELWKQGSPLTHAGPHTPAILFINSSVDRMHAGREDFIKVLNQYSIYSEVKTFEGSPHSFPLFEPWFDSTVQIMDIFLTKVFEKSVGAPIIIVSKDGSGNFTSVQEALDTVPLKNTKEQIIFIRNGINKEKLFLNSTHFTFKAEAKNSDTTSVHPDFAILIYPVISFNSSITHKGSRNNLAGAHAAADKISFFSNELHVNAVTAPVFLVYAGDDMAVPVENSIRFYQSCIKNKMPVEMHLYPVGGHGFGLFNKTTTDNWMERLKNWLNSLYK